MTLNEIKRLNNILHKHTGLGTEEKQVDDTIFYPSCYYLNKVIESICEKLEFKIEDNEDYMHTEIKGEVELLPEDIETEDYYDLEDYDPSEKYNYDEVLKIYKLNYGYKRLNGSSMKTAVFSSYRIHNNKISFEPTSRIIHLLAVKEFNQELDTDWFKNKEELESTELEIAEPTILIKFDEEDLSEEDL